MVYVGSKCKLNMHENVRNMCEILDGSIVGKGPHWTPISKWQCDNIVDLKERGKVI
jgi:hypothetical protein